MRHPFDMPEVFSDPDIHGGQPVVESGVPIYLILGVKTPAFRHGMKRRLASWYRSYFQFTGTV
jgi:hypothetical protein